MLKQLTVNLTHCLCSLPYHKPREEAALEQLHLFIEEGLEAYDVSRDYPEYDGTSRLSVYLRTGKSIFEQFMQLLVRLKQVKAKLFLSKN